MSLAGGVGDRLGFTLTEMLVVITANANRALVPVSIDERVTSQLDVGHGP